MFLPGRIQGTVGIVLLIAAACNNKKEKSRADVVSDSVHSCVNIPVRFANADYNNTVLANGDSSTAGMKYIPGGTFMRGGDNDQASEDEYPKHNVVVNAFWMDETEVTNAQFQKFVGATGYITTAAQKPDWEELKKSMPPGTTKPPDSVLVAASLVFKQSNEPVDLHDFN